jgi:hypothetical protein
MSLSGIKAVVSRVVMSLAHGPPKDIKQQANSALPRFENGSKRMLPEYFREAPDFHRERFDKVKNCRINALREEER